MVVSEAPTWSEAGSETFYSMTVALAERGVSTDDLCAFWRAYPFTDDLTQFGFPGESRHRLYRQYVETFLSFVDDPEASIGFADVVKRPLDEGEDLRDALAGPYEYGLALRRQLEFVDPAVVVCNKTNVSEVVPALLGEVPPNERVERPTSLDVTDGDLDTTLVFSAMAHLYMDTFSRSRLVREIERHYQTAQVD